MKIKLKIVAVFVCLATFLNCFAQTNKDEALTKLKDAIKLEDDGKIDDAIKLIKEALELAPDDYTYPYEIAYAYYSKKDYASAEDYLKKCLKYKNFNAQVYQLLGNCYDDDGKSKKALETYEDGLKKFPEAGNLYLETGITLLKQNDYNKGLANFEKGIEVDPTFPSNYYHAAKIFLSNTNEKVWGMIYGELFMNLERNSKRTAEISKLLYDTYKSQVVFTTDTSISISFSKMNTINVDDIKKLKLPYGMMVYEGTTSMAVIGIKNINLNSLDILRTNFINFYFKKFNKDYPNALFTYQNEIFTAGQFEAYNYWLLSKGDETAFEQWREANKEKWAAFIKWYQANPIPIDKDNRFYRAQYN